MRRLRNAYLAGAALSVIGLVINQGASAATLDDVLARLDKIEQSNQKLAKENAALRERLQRIEGSKGGSTAAVAPVPAAGPAVHADPKQSNPVGHAAVASTPAPSGALVSIGGNTLITKGGHGWIDNTTVTLYGHMDVSLDLFNNGVYDQHTGFGVASNNSSFGVRVRHNLAPYGWDGYAIVAQIESQVDIAAAPNERAAFGTKDSYLGLEGPWGAIKAGKSDTPYKKSTAAFDPFANSLGDYNSIMGNTGGDNRAEWDWRMNHAIWYESPIINHFQFSVLMSPGQNLATDNSNYAYGDMFQCNGASPRGSGSNFPGTGGAGAPNGGGNIGGQNCTDGSFGNAYSAALTYKDGPLTVIGAYELHQGVNRTGDDNTGVNGGAPIVLPDGSVVVTGIHDEWAAKVGAGYLFKEVLAGLQIYGAFEWIRRTGAPAAFNERSKNDAYVSFTQFLDKHWSFSGSWVHAFAQPGNPATQSPNNVSAIPPPFGPGATYQANLFSANANQYALGLKYKFNDFASWYLTGVELTQGLSAHYCLGASGHGYQVCSRDAFNNTIGGQTIKAVTTGMTFDF